MSFRSKLNLLFTSLILSIGLGSIWLQKYQQQQIIQISLQEQAISISTLIADDFAKIIYFNETSSMTIIASQLKKIPSLISAHIFDTKGKLLLKVISKAETNNTYKTSTKLTYQGSNIGKINFIFYDNKLTNKSKFFELYFMFSIVLFSIIGLILVFFIDKKFISRLEVLNLALKETAISKDFSFRLNPSLTDEIGRAQANFDNLIATVEDKTSKLEFQANHDSLTGLYSREVLLENIKVSIRIKATFFHAVCYIDLDQFKVVNDTCGHKAGDMLLAELAIEFKLFLKTYPNTTIGRIGGDEFILLIKNRSLPEINDLTADLLKTIRNLNFKFMERSFPVGASIGVITYKETTLFAGDILSSADAACYEAKEKGRNQIVCHSLCENNLSVNQQEMNLVSKIYNALDEDGFKLFLQPIVSAKHISTTEYNIFETLLRMPSKVNKGEIISPALFIPASERYGLSEKVDYWVVDNLFKKISNEPLFIKSVKYISINLSISSLASNEMQHKIMNLFLKHNIDFHKICFEITETGVSSQVDKAIKFIDFFKELGVSFSLDDFGTGMSSFSYLSQLDVDFLKIDGHFISNMENDLIKQEMVHAMVRIGKTLNKKVVAEYVETEKAIRLLQDMQVDYLQGYYFSQAHPIQYFIDKIKSP